MGKITKLFALLLTGTATVMASSACIWFMYQPKEPECLKEE